MLFLKISYVFVFVLTRQTTYVYM